MPSLRLQLQETPAQTPCRRDRLPTPVFLGFPGGSAGKEPACDAGDPGSVPGSGRSAGGGIGCPLQCSWASLVAQLVKNPPAMQETWVGKIPWRRERLPTPVFWPGEFHGLYSPWGQKELNLTEVLSPTPVFFPGESQRQRSLVGCRLLGSHRFGHDWSDRLSSSSSSGRTTFTFITN